MRKDTEIWLRLESIGYPRDTEVLEGTLMALLPLMAKWLLRVNMGSRIQIAIARTAESLMTTKAKDANELEAMFDDILARADEGTDDELEG